MLYLTKVFLVRDHIRHDLIQNRWRCFRQWRIPCMRRLRKNKLAMWLRLHSLRRGTYYDRSHLSGTNNQRSYKQGWWSNNATQTGNKYKPLVSHLRVIFSMCCTESYGASWDKDVKHASPSAKRVLRYLRWYSRASKRISCLRTQYKKVNIFIWCCIWQNFV